MNKISKYYKNVIAHHPHNVTHTLSLCNAKPKDTINISDGVRDN